MDAKRWFLHLAIDTTPFVKIFQKNPTNFTRKKPAKKRKTPANSVKNPQI